LENISFLYFRGRHPLVLLLLDKMYVLFRCIKTVTYEILILSFWLPVSVFLLNHLQAKVITERENQCAHNDCTCFGFFH